MGVAFDIFDPATDEFLDDLGVGMTTTNAKVVANAIGFDLHPDGDTSYPGGSCTVAELRAHLERFPDGHPDPFVTERFGWLARMVTAAERTGRANLRVHWG